MLPWHGKNKLKRHIKGSLNLNLVAEICDSAIVKYLKNTRSTFLGLNIFPGMVKGLIFSKNIIKQTPLKI